MTNGMTLRSNNQEIILKTEPQENIPGFIWANSLCRTCSLPVIVLPPEVALPVCECETPTNHPVIEKDCRKGEHLMLCGAGPSLGRLRSVVQAHEGDVWGCNRALNYLHDWGVTKAIGVAIDPSTRMFGTVWADAPKTTYYLATSVNPGLVWHLEPNPIRYFHSVRGCDDEVTLYQSLYPRTCLAGYGLNVVNRAVDLAEYMGYKTISLVGADNALGKDDAMYPDGSKGDAVQDVVLEGRIGKKKWRTKTDMLMSAVSLVQKQRAMKNNGQTLMFLGETLPKALQYKSQEYLDRCVSWGENSNIDPNKTGY